MNPRRPYGASGGKFGGPLLVVEGTVPELETKDVEVPTKIQIRGRRDEDAGFPQRKTGCQKGGKQESGRFSTDFPAVVVKQDLVRGADRPMQHHQRTLRGRNEFHPSILINVSPRRQSGARNSGR